MRPPNKKLLREVLEKTITKLIESDGNSGICTLLRTTLYELNIPSNTYNNVIRWFNKQKPSTKNHSQFTKSSSFYGGGWWWNKNKRGTQERIKFLRYLIKSLTKN